MQKRGKIITIEGSDGSGKKTQTKLLVEKAMTHNLPVATMSFPRYETPTGQRVKKYLEGGFGNLNEVDVKFVIKLYTDDRLAVKSEILGLLSEGKNLIFDRWIESNMGHQGAKFKKEDRQMAVDYIRKMEVVENGLPESDLIVYLYLPFEFAQKAMETEGRKKDLHERDREYLAKVEDTYEWLARKNKNWVRINCIENDGRLTPEEVAEKIWKVAEPVLVR
jgi:dTMP kinase